MTDNKITFAPFTIDDRLWVSEFDVAGLFDLFFDPVRMIGTNPNGKDRLLSPFAISMQTLLSASNPHTFFLQGINRTNLITLRAAENAAALAFAPLSERDHRTEFLDALERRLKPGKGINPRIQSEEWIELKKFFGKFFHAGLRDDFMNRNIEITVIDDDNRAYLHFPIWPDDSSAVAQRAAAAAFHCYSVTDPKFLDDVLNTPEGDKHSVTHAKKAGNGQLQKVKFEKVKLKHKRAAGTNALLHLGKKPPTISLLVDDELACEMLVARYNAQDGTVTYQEAFAKSYTSA